VEIEARRLGLVVERVRMRPRISLHGVRALLELARRVQADVVHAHGFKADVLLALVPRRRRRPVLTTLHGWTHTSLFSRIGIYGLADGISLRFLDRIVLVSEAMRSRRWIRSLPADRVVVIPNGLAQPSGKTCEALPFPLPRDGGMTFGAMGRLSPEKGFDILLAAFGRAVRGGVDARLVIAGEGRLKHHLEGLARSAGLERRVALPGYAPRSLVQRLDALIVSSRTEGFPMVVLEAMLAGVPVIATAVGDIPLMLDGGRAGLLVPPGSVSALAGAIEDASREPVEMASRARAAHARARSEYTSARMATTYRVEYERLLRGWGSPPR
jgi:glycosyltransferase involved in cell wall biosynthesis